MTGLQANQIWTSDSDFVITSYGLEEGLPQNTVNSVIQSIDGYLWVGTHGGLVRFDGVAFRVYDRFNTPELVSDRIIALFEDSRNVLWMGSESGGLAYKKREHFRSYKLDYPLSQYNIVTITECHQGSIWAGTSGGGLIRITDEDRNGNTIQLYTVNEGLHHDIIADVYCSQDDNLYVVTGNGISVFDGEKFNNLIDNTTADFYEMHVLHEDSEGNLWVGSRGYGLLTIQNDTVSHFSLNESLASTLISTIFEDRDGVLWFGTENALSRFKDGQLKNLTATEGLSDSNIISITQDHEGTIWAGSKIGGINKLVASNISVVRNPEANAVNNITSITKSSDGGLYFGLNCGGVGYLSDGEMTIMDIPLPNSCVWSILEDSGGTLWIGTWGRGLSRWKNGRMESMDRTTGFISNIVLAIYEDSKGTVWLGTPFNGVIRYQNGEFENFTRSDGLIHHDVRAIHEDRNGDLWFGTFHGPVRLKDGNFTDFRESHGLAEIPIRFIYEDQEGIIWFGTYGGGLIRYKNDQFNTITTENGLSDNLIAHILEDDQGYFWMGSNRGIQRVSRHDLNEVADGHSNSRVISKLFGREEGMVSRETNGGFQPSAIRTPDGRLWFPTIEGIAMVDPMSVMTSQIAPPVMIEEVQLGDETFIADREVVIEPGIRNFSIRFTAMSFVSPAKVEFQSKLEGYDPDWKQIGSRREEFYTNIPPGNYTFRVIAGNHDNVWNLEGAAVNIKILPAIWQTGWFRFISAVLLLGSFAGILFYASTRRLKRQLERMEMQQSMERERLRIAQDLHDELGSRLTEIKILGELSRREDVDLTKLKNRLHEMSNASVEVIDTFREVVWSVDPQNDTLENLIDYFTQFASEYFDRAGIRCRFDIPVDMINCDLTSDVRHHLLMIYKELCNNIVKHSGATEVTTKIAFDAPYCKIMIFDNGSGFDLDSGDVKGNGLRNINQRIEAVKGAIYVDSKPGFGTNVEISFQIQ